MKTTKKVFRSRISVLFIGFTLAPFIPVSIRLVSDKSYEGLYLVGGLLLFIFLLLSGIRYIIDENHLYIKTWFIPSGSVNILNITSVKRSYNPLSSPASSLKRLCIYSVDGRLRLVSPVREQEFIEELKAVNPDMRVNVPKKEGGLWRIWDWDL